ncbi:pyruvate kinase [uncultured Phascolarctobacterium sp.]|uniref:pyruvate kinase n=1 Tax=Phascolarctobacterium sp. TaxID=2049039 RepID=UPI0025F21599|nr:pyruvate kinase [uncultured Phascolarctobacterium sp.]
MKKTKIICTVGPSTDNIPLLAAMLEAGMDLARFNFSHGSHEDHAHRLGMVREAAAQINKPIAMIADTRGPEMRLGIFEHDKITLQEGDAFCLTTRERLGNERIASVNYDGLPGELKEGDAILLADGLLSLEVEKIEGSEIYTRVVHGGQLGSRKRVACPGVELKLPFLSEQDIDDISFAIKQDMDYIAASFVQKADDVIAIRKVLEAAGSKMGIISKIENQAGFEHIDEIIDVSDGVMVARGDLGVEIPAEYVPLVQKEIIKRCNKAGKPVITATQMLESMVSSYRATRAEASDIANAIFDGTDVIMLSGETASGAYPLEAVQTMAKIALRTEEALDYAAIFKGKGISDRIHSTEAISHATVQIAQELDADAIVTVTESGFTARMIAKYRPKCYVVGVSRIPDRVRAMQLYWGVRPLLGPSSDNTDEMIDLSLQCAREHGYVREGDSVVITAGVPIGKPGSTNLIKVVNVGNKLVSGVGIGKRSVTGKVCKAVSLADFQEKFKPGEILVVGVLPDETARYAAKASAIIAEEGGLTSSVAIIAINCGIPVVVGAANALELLKDGMEVTVDTVSGIVYEGAINI